MLDKDLAELYDVETRVLNQSGRRNIKRFPPDFMFRLSKEEMEIWKSQIVMSNREKMGFRKPPLAFTEQGVAMLSSVLRSERAIMVNIQINIHLRERRNRPWWDNRARCPQCAHIVLPHLQSPSGFQ